jgi:hypothetical protein
VFWALPSAGWSTLGGSGAVVSTTNERAAASPSGVSPDNPRTKNTCPPSPSSDGAGSPDVQGLKPASSQPHSNDVARGEENVNAGCGSFVSPSGPESMLTVHAS